MPSTAGFFAATHQEVLAEIEAGGVHFERLPRNQAGPMARQATFCRFAVTREKMLSHDELKDCVAQELESLIVEMLFLFFVRDARMGEGLSQETRISKMITDALFERVHVFARGRRLFGCFS